MTSREFESFVQSITPQLVSLGNNASHFLRQDAELLTDLADDLERVAKEIRATVEAR